MKDNKEKNLKHIDLIEIAIHDYEKKSLRFNSFVSRLDEIIMQLDSIPNDKRTILISCCQDLEEINAVTINNADIKNQNIVQYFDDISSIISVIRITLAEIKSTI